MMGRMGAWGVCGTVVMTVGLAAQPPAAPGQQPPVFKAGVELVTVDASVIDRDGRPVEGLQADDFTVTVDGRPRRIATVEFTRFAPPVPSSAAPPPAAGPDRAPVDSKAVRSDRLIMLAFDHASFYPLGTRGASVAARRFLATLGPADRVGLVSYPQTGVFVAPTTDRGVVDRELGRVLGTAVPPAADGRPFVSLTEAAAIRDGDPFTLDRVRARECAGLSPSLMQSCAHQVEMVARERVNDEQDRTSQSLRALGDVLERLGALPGRKVMVLISGGLVTALSRSGESSSALLSQVASRAAAANVAIHVLHIDTGILDAIDAARRQMSETLSGDLNLQSAGLSDIAGSTGGVLMTVAGEANFAFDRVARTISATYVLGVETEVGDRDGRPHTISVKVRRPGVRVLSRQQFRIAPANAGADSRGTGPAAPVDPVADALRSGRESGGLPLRVAAFRMKDVESGRGRVLLRVDAGRGVTGPAELKIGLAFVDATGRVSQTEIRPQTLAASAGPDAAWILQSVVPLEAGEYTVRAAVTDPEGRLGSASVRVNAAVPQGPGAAHSDLLLYDPSRFGAGGPVPLIDGRVLGAEVSVLWEVYPSGSAPVTHVEFSLAKAGAAPAQTWAGRLAREADGAMVGAEAAFDLSELPAGEYVVTATAMAATRELARASATFRKER